MKKIVWILGGVVAVMGVNAFIDSQRECGCRPDCWCKQPGLSLFRWVFPFGHSLAG